MYTDFCSILHRNKCILSSGKYGNITTMCIAIYFKPVPMTAVLLALVCLKPAANQCLSSYNNTNYFQPSVPEEIPCTEQNTLISTFNFTSICNVNSVTPSYIPIIMPILLNITLLLWKTLFLSSYITVIKKH